MGRRQGLWKPPDMSGPCCLAFELSDAPTMHRTRLGLRRDVGRDWGVTGAWGGAALPETRMPGQAQIVADMQNTQKHGP